MGKLNSRKKPDFQKSNFGKGSKHASPQREKVNSGRSRISKIQDKVQSQLVVGHFDSPARLRDASWLVPQIVQLSRTQFPQALQLYTEAKQVGFDPSEISVDDCRQLFGSLVAAAIRSGKVHEVEKLFVDIRVCGNEVCGSVFASAVKVCTSSKAYGQALTVLEWVSKDPTFVLTDKSVWSCLLFCAVEAKAYPKCSELFEHVKACGMPSSKDFGNMIRLATFNGDWQKCLTIIKDMHESNVEIDTVQFNTALATCVTAGKMQDARELLDAMEIDGGLADVVTYNTLMKGYARAGCIDDCFEVFDKLHKMDISPSQVSYGILLDCCINENQVDRAMEVFNNMTKGGCPMNTILYTMLIKGFVRSGDCDQAMKVYGQMKTERSIAPDLITFSILIKANCDSDRPKAALQLLEDMIALGLKPDEVVFNDLIAGCARQSNAQLGKQLYEDMVASGIRPSNATFSILIRVLYQCRMLEEAVVLLKTEPAKHNVEPEDRLFLQLMQSCIRERQGKRTIEVYTMLSERSVGTAAMHSSVFATCMKLNMLDTAAEILQVAAEKHARVDARDTKLLVEAAFKKGKTQIVQSCIASMHALGHAVDAKLVA